MKNAKTVIKKSKSKSKSKGPVRAKKTTVDGIIFDSRMESRYYTHLKYQKEIGAITNFVLQPCFTLVPAYVKDGRKVQAITYSPDYEITYPDGRVEYIDVKGRSTEVFKIKRKLFDYYYPDLKLLLVIETEPDVWEDYDTYKKRMALEKRRKTIAKKKALAEKNK